MIFGGPYSNLQATQAVLLESVKRVANPVCTGDLVAYCAWPTETVAAFSSANFEVIAGNCEVQLAARANSCGCGFTSDSVCNALSIDWFGFASSSIKIFERKWMASLPDVISFTHSGANYGVIHGGASDVARFFGHLQSLRFWKGIGLRLKPLLVKWIIFYPDIVVFPLLDC
ncbi:MAG: metallophosphoesterase [Tateyamaria sp.]|nr:metallophosphoesterase [Tateyamaria sp.]